MRLRNMIFMAALAFMMAGCVITPRSSYVYDQPYDEGYYDYRGTPSYEGYYYVRIIFIRNVPYYVDDDRYIRPVPPRLYDHFRNYPYSTLGRPPVFSRDKEVRDGYPVSRIIYLDGVPYNVGNDRIAQPLPERLRPRFRYTPADQGNAKDNRPQLFRQHDNGRNDELPVQVRDRDREHLQQPPPVHGQREDERDTSADFKGRLILSPEPHSLPLRQDQPTAGDSHTDTANGKARDRNRPEAIGDTFKKKSDKKPEKKNTNKKNADKKDTRAGKKDKQDDSTQTDDGSDKKDHGKKPRNGKDDDQGNNDRVNGNRRD